jgi:glycosyltransferase involved in cell wall biosynthesis
VPPGDVAALAGVLGDLLANPQQRERLSAGARAAAHGAYSWDAAAQQTLALYREVAA